PGIGVDELPGDLRADRPCPPGHQDPASPVEVHAYVSAGKARPRSRKPEVPGTERAAPGGSRRPEHPAAQALTMGTEVSVPIYEGMLRRFRMSFRRASSSVRS